MTTEESSYNINQVQEMVRNGIQTEMASIQTEMAAWCQQIFDENANPNFPSPPPPPKDLQMLLQMLT